MKKILLIIIMSIFNIAYSQNNSLGYNNEIIDLKTYIENIYKKDSKKIKSYVKNEKTGKIFPIKTDDIYSEFDFEFYYTYDFLRKNDKVVYARKTYISPTGDSSIFYDYYFSNDGRLIGAEKNVSSFYGDNKIVFYKIQYELSYKTDKLERVSEIYTDENEKKIERNSKLYKEAVEEGLILSYIEGLDRITFKDLESFMQAEKIKYYRDNKSDSKITNLNSEKDIEKRKTTEIGNLIRGRSNKANNYGNPLGGDGNGDSKIGVDRKLIGFIPGTLRRGGTQPSHKCSTNGTVSISYTVDKAGNVVSARRSSGVTDSCIVSTSILWIKKYVKAETSNTSSSGTYKISF